MRLLLDTHIVVWSVLDPDALTAGERDCMDTADDPPVVSAVSVWELRLKWNNLHTDGQRKGPIDPASVVAFTSEMGWTLLPLTAHHAVARLAPPLSHRDPFDELLLVQAQEEGLRFLTRDARLVGHPLAVASR